MNNISNRVEQILSHAVALDQSGRLCSTIYALQNNIYILNQDHTVLLKFNLRASEASFSSPISFRANDYDSRHFKEEDGKVVFYSESSNFSRKKFCKTPGMSPEEVERLFNGYSPEKGSVIQLSKEVIGLLNESLSHIEFKAESKKLKIIQRNIYDGTLLEIFRSSSGGFDVIQSDQIDRDFGPIGLRTNDFIALYSFQDLLTIHFCGSDKDGFIYVKGNDVKIPFEGIIACCFYDEMGWINPKKEEHYGRQIT